MSSTNKTTHYNLSQYIASDKPTYLVDYNSDMSAIDSAVYNADSLAQTNEASIGVLSELDTTVKTDLVSAINEVEGVASSLSTTVADHTTSIATNTSAIGTLANLDTSNKSNLVSAINEVLNEFNFTATELDPDQYVFSPQGYREGGSIKVAKNSTGTLCKIYGDLRVACTPNIPFTITTGDTGLRPTSEIFIEGLNYCYQINDHTVDKVEVYLQTDGKVRINMTTRSTAGTIINIIPCLIFVKDFGDVPVQQ